jgi:hypothetical protein
MDDLQRTAVRMIRRYASDPETPRKVERAYMVDEGSARMLAAFVHRHRQSPGWTQEEDDAGKAFAERDHYERLVREGVPKMEARIAATAYIRRVEEILAGDAQP